MTAANSPDRQCADLDLSAIPDGREEIARMIMRAFADAGFGVPQQLASLANAIAESNLDPAAMTVSPDQSVGLFQLNRAHGLGVGHSVAELQDPAVNIDIMVADARKFDDFAKATSLEDAVSIFVRKLMRPSNVAGELARRLKIAERLKPAS